MKNLTHLALLPLTLTTLALVAFSSSPQSEALSLKNSAYGLEISLPEGIQIATLSAGVPSRHEALLQLATQISQNEEPTVQLGELADEEIAFLASHM